MALTLDEAKTYLRVDSSDEDDLITSLIESANQICTDIVRASEAVSSEETPVFHVAVLFTLAYLYEHREEADHHALNETLRNLLQGVREAKF